MKNVSTSNMSADIKLSKTQLSKENQMNEFLGKMLGNVMNNLGKKALLDSSVPLAKDVLPKLAIKATFFAIDKINLKEKQEGEDLQEQEENSLSSFQMKIWMILLKSQSHWKIQVY